MSRKWARFDLTSEQLAVLSVDSTYSVYVVEGDFEIGDLLRKDQNLADLTDAGAAIGNLGAQPLHTYLTRICQLSAQTGFIPYMSSAGSGGVWAKLVSTAAGRAMVEAATAAAQLTLIGAAAAPGAWTALTMDSAVGGGTKYTTASPTTASGRLFEGVLELSGRISITSGGVTSGDHLCTVPAALLPSATVTRRCVGTNSSGAAIVLSVTSAGVLTYASSTAAGATFIDLDGARFRVV